MTLQEIETAIFQHSACLANARAKFATDPCRAWSGAIAHHSKWIAQLEADLQTYGQYDPTNDDD